jgi:hypothetical protein
MACAEAPSAGRESSTLGPMRIVFLDIDGVVTSAAFR